jgi:hypothetical protein
VAIPAELAWDVAGRVARIGAFVAGGVFLANLVVAYGLVERVAGLSRHLTRPANLPDAVGTAILTTAASTTAGYGMLADFRESGLSDRATLVAVTINTFFGFVQHVFTFYAPVLIPILGVRTGALYVGARASVALAITCTGVLGGALLLDRDAEPAALSIDAAGGDAKGPDGGEANDDDAADDTDDRPPHREAWAGTRRTLRRVVPRLVVVYALVAVLTARYDLTRLTAAADPLVA